MSKKILIIKLEKLVLILEEESLGMNSSPINFTDLSLENLRCAKYTNLNKITFGVLIFHMCIQ